ncbi:heterokaryon incompatibility protein HET-C [Favolaschia claudopus]|uniref:Heterokaryon incompatibility protein HET-C n=1 Tax=Favolaschia claudopus TaxID=2862362 RepID=A0AAW0EI12_9AGAR
MSSSQTTNFILLTTIVLVFLPAVHAFGAGDIPDFAYLNDKAFRHGDIENILSTLAKTAGHVAASGQGGNLFGFAKSLIDSATSGSGGAKFTSGDIKKVYFGNWLRDYSQCMDIGGLSKLSADSLVLIVSVLGFMTFGFATEEYQVTAERLGVYLPVEHIDNPKGYGEKEGDPRQFHPKLRPPVQRRELEIDSSTGMKNYMATEDGGWDTSTAHIRRVLTACIEMGRRANGQDGPDLYEAYRLLGTGLHTLEDLLAHSNWVEIALRKMGHSEVFCHVGDATDIETPNGRAPPLVTGTFGGADFLHSLMGEATDKLSQASVTDLAGKMDQAKNNDDSNVSQVQSILSKLPISGGGESKMDEAEEIHKEAKAYHFDPNNVAPPEVQQKLMQLLRWHDDVMRWVLEKIEMIPGLDSLIDQLSNALNAYVYTVIAPWLSPLLQQATSALGEGSKAVIDTEDQYEVFDNPRASDPSHSLLSKDHFGLILNEPAGKIAMLVVKHSVNIIVQAWSDNSDPSRAVDEILEAFHHPYYATGRSSIQQNMFREMESWLQKLDEDQARETIAALTKESVRNGKNKRLGSENEDLSEPGYGGCGHGAQPQRYGSGGGGQSQENQSSYSGGRNTGYSGRDETEYSSNNEYSRGNNEGRRQTEEYGGSGGRNTGYSGRDETEYSSNNEYSRGNNEGRRQTEEYGSSRDRRKEDNESSGYGSSNAQRGESYSGSSGYQPSYGGGNEYESRNESSSYDQSSGGYRGRRSDAEQQEERYGNEQSNTRAGYGASGYGNRDEASYGARDSGYGGAGQGQGYGRSEEEQSYGSSDRYESSGRGSSSSYSSRRNEEESDGAYGSSGASGYGRSEGYEQSSESRYERTEERNYESRREQYGEQEQESSGYGGRGYGDRDETFGAERLNIREDNGGYGGESYERGADEYERDY